MTGPMIRLLAAVDGPRWTAAAARLTGVAIETSLERFDSCDGIISESERESTIAKWLSLRKHFLHVGPPTDAWSPALSDLAHQYNAQLLVMNPDRYLPSRQLIKQMLPDKLGDSGLIRMHRWSPSSASPLVGLACDVDTVLWLVGDLPNSVYALERDDGRFRQVHLGFPGGGMALIDVDGRSPEGEGYQSLSVIGSSGAAYADDHQNMQLLYRGGHPQAVKTEEGTKQTVGMLQAFVEAIRSGRDSSENGAAWSNGDAVLKAVKESIRTRQAVPFGGPLK